MGAEEFGPFQTRHRHCNDYLIIDDNRRAKDGFIVIDCAGWTIFHIMLKADMDLL